MLLQAGSKTLCFANRFIELEVIGDDPAILTDMPVFCRRTGHRLLAMRQEGGQ